MSALIDLSGQTFGRLTVLSRDGTWVSPLGGDSKPTWRCRCQCGVEVVVTRPNLGRKTLSCGCLQRETAASNAVKFLTTHGGRRTPLYTTWAGMKQRCLDQNHHDYVNYGGRGIRVCDEWACDFVAFRDWIKANLGPRPEGYSLDRINNDGNYEPGNVRWASAKEQMANRSRGERAA